MLSRDGPIPAALFSPIGSKLGQVEAGALGLMDYGIFFSDSQFLKTEVYLMYSII